MIEESYVSFETARLLKEAGFREHSRCMYYEEKDGSYKLYKCLIGDYDVSTDKSYEGDLYGERYLAPTQALAARWLCEHKMIEVSVAYCRRRKSWYYWVGYLDCEDEDVTFGFNYASRQYAMEAGLQEAIKLIKK